MALGGNLEQIKRNVWKLEKDGNYYSVKRYESSATAVKVKSLHETLQSVSFPHIISVLPNHNELTFIQPWLNHAKAVNFRKRADRTDSLTALFALHDTKKQVDWSLFPYLYRYPLITKWTERIRRFHAIKEACAFYIGEAQVEEILFYANHALEIVKKNYDDRDGTLLHGDVVHHNMLRDKNGLIRFIDFDLASTGPAGTEIALWMHRVLPQIDYNVAFLMDEQPALCKLDYGSKVMLLYPNELLREWLHFFSLSARAQRRQVKNLLPFTTSALSHWPQLWYNVERMKN